MAEGDQLRLNRVKTWIQMRYGRSLKDYLDEMEFLISVIEKQEKQIETLHLNQGGLD